MFILLTLTGMLNTICSTFRSQVIRFGPRFLTDAKDLANTCSNKIQHRMVACLDQGRAEFAVPIGFGSGA
jgi:hypothetical protein